MLPDRAPARNSFPPSLPSAPEFPDPLLRKMMVERGAPDGEVADHVADEGIAPGIPQHRLGLAAQLRRRLARPPTPPAAGPRCGKAGHGPLPDEIALELGQCPEDVEDQRAAGGGVQPASRTGRKSQASGRRRKASCQSPTGRGSDLKIPAWERSAVPDCTRSNRNRTRGESGKNRPVHDGIVRDPTGRSVRLKLS